MRLYLKPEYIKNEPLYTQWKDLYEGDQQTLRDSKYLFLHELETLEQGIKIRSIREQRTHYTNFIEPLIGIWTGLFFKDEPIIPDDVKAMLGDEIDDIDGEGNSLVAFMRDNVARNYFIYGNPIIRVNALGDKPKTKGEETLKKFRPYLEMLNPLDVKDWKIERDDPLNLNKIIFLRFEYLDELPRARSTDAIVLQPVSKELYLEGKKLYIQKYRLKETKANEPLPTQIANADSREWEVVGEPKELSEWDEIPIVALFNGESWIKDIAPQALKYHNLESVLDNIHLFQAHQRIQAIGDNLKVTEVGFAEYCISTWPLGTSFHVIEPTDTTAIEKRLLQVRDNLFKIALNQVKQLAGDSAGVQGAETIREERQDTIALIQSEIESLENITNKAIELYAKFKGILNFKSEITLSREINETDLDQMSKAFLIIRDDIAKIPSLKKAAVKRFALELDLDEDSLEEINNDIDTVFNNAKATDTPTTESDI
jgi:hypothetical protein